MEQKKYDINVIKKTVDFSNMFFKNINHLINFQFQNKNNRFLGAKVWIKENVLAPNPINKA